ncbi:ATP-binding protein, partial [Candidatus Micrarchaeota archaeon]|nr:ATP-binding protein [Candidatus Micrarchaeota archaeon]
MSLEEELIESNPWWKGNFFDISLKPREIYGGIEPYLKKRQIIGIYGLRRTGKSYLVYHMIKQLLEKESPKTILYFSFDDFSEANASDVLKTAEKLTETKIKFIFFDEVQKLNNWAEQIKRLYDLKSLKIVVTGSETLFLRKTSKESLAGRIFEFKIEPLSFKEYLAFRKIPQTGLYKDEMIKALDHYVLIGGFPELVDEFDNFFIRKYIREGIIDKAIYQDIPKRYKLEDPSLLERIMNIIIDNPGLLIDKNNLANTLGVFRTTVSKYLFYLESSFLIKGLYNYSRNASTSEKKLKKYYPGFSPLGVGLKSDPTYLGKVV